MKPLRASDLRHQIELRRPHEVEDGRGGYTPSWQSLGTAFAEVTGLDGRESVMDQVLQGVSVYRIRIRWRDGLQVNDQAVHGGRSLNLRSIVDPDGRRRELVIMADSASVRSES